MTPYTFWGFSPEPRGFCAFASRPPLPPPPPTRSFVQAGQLPLAKRVSCVIRPTCFRRTLSPSRSCRVFRRPRDSLCHVDASRGRDEPRTISPGRRVVRGFPRFWTSQSPIIVRPFQRYYNAILCLSNGPSGCCAVPLIADHLRHYVGP